MNIEQFVMAYCVEHDKLRAILPDGFMSLRPALRINAEIHDGTSGRSTGKTLSAMPSNVKKTYPKEIFSVKNAAKIPCDMVLGSYMVEFERL